MVVHVEALRIFRITNLSGSIFRYSLTYHMCLLFNRYRGMQNGLFDFLTMIFPTNNNARWPNQEVQFQKSEKPDKP